jgi:hypothetical protein
LKLDCIGHHKPKLGYKAFLLSILSLYPKAANLTVLLRIYKLFVNFLLIANGSKILYCPQFFARTAEKAASSPLYPLLKRTDERHVTMKAYDKPAFVEDITRDVALNLKEYPEIEQCLVKVTNYESIHNHNAFAVASWER